MIIWLLEACQQTSTEFEWRPIKPSWTIAVYAYGRTQNSSDCLYVSMLRNTHTYAPVLRTGAASNLSKCSTVVYPLKMWCWSPSKLALSPLRSYWILCCAKQFCKILSRPHHVLSHAIPYQIRSDRISSENFSNQSWGRVYSWTYSVYTSFR